MDNAESLFVSGASFRGVSTCVRRLKLMSDAANDISAVVRSQYEEFSELSEVEFDGRYKVESDECFSISDYVDADGTFASFQEIINGNCSDVLKNTDSLSECRALLFRAPQLPNLVLIQRFTNSYLAKRDRWFGSVAATQSEKSKSPHSLLHRRFQGSMTSSQKDCVLKVFRTSARSFRGFLISMRPERTRRPLQPSSDSQSSIKIVQTKSKRLIR